jgi:hypothetical protein
MFMGSVTSEASVDLVGRTLTLPQLREELVRRHEEWIRLQQPTDDHHRVGAHDVHNYARAKLGE